MKKRIGMSIVVLGIIAITMSSCICTPEPVPAAAPLAAAVVTTTTLPAPPPTTTTLPPPPTTTTVPPPPPTTTTLPPPVPTTTTTTEPLPLLPAIVVAETDTKLFTPDGDGKADVSTFTLSATTPSRIVKWSLQVFEPAPVEGPAPASPAVFRSWSGTGMPPDTIAWNGLSDSGAKVESAFDYPYVFKATYIDGEVAESEGIQPVGALVVKEGDRYRIHVASIVFRPASSDFEGLNAGVIVRNDEALDRIAATFALYPGYRIIVEGHANNESKIAGASAEKIVAEETAEILPLSLARATTIRDKLIAKSVEAARMSAVGKGSSEPLVSFQDAANRWKNRRVDFILYK